MGVMKRSMEQPKKPTKKAPRKTTFKTFGVTPDAVKYVTESEDWGDAVDQGLDLLAERDLTLKLSLDDWPHMVVGRVSPRKYEYKKSLTLEVRARTVQTLIMLIDFALQNHYVDFPDSWSDQEDIPPV